MCYAKTVRQDRVPPTSWKWRDARAHLGYMEKQKEGLFNRCHCGSTVADELLVYMLYHQHLLPRNMVLTVQCNALAATELNVSISLKSYYPKPSRRLSPPNSHFSLSAVPLPRKDIYTPRFHTLASDFANSCKSATRCP